MKPVHGAPLTTIVFYHYIVNSVSEQFGYKHSSKHISLWSAEQQNIYRFETTWNYEKKNFWWTIPLG